MGRKQTSAYHITHTQRGLSKNLRHPEPTETGDTHHFPQVGPGATPPTASRGAYSETSARAMGGAQAPIGACPSFRVPISWIPVLLFDETQGVVAKG